MEDTARRLPHGVLPLLVSDTRGKGIGVSHHHITGGSPEDDIQAEGSQDPFLQSHPQLSSSFSFHDHVTRDVSRLSTVSHSAKDPPYFVLALLLKDQIEITRDSRDEPHPNAQTKRPGRSAVGYLRSCDPAEREYRTRPQTTPPPLCSKSVPHEGDMLDAAPAIGPAVRSWE